MTKLKQETLKIAVLGAGSVGREVLRLLAQNASEYQNRIGVKLEVNGIFVRDSRDRGPYVNPELFNFDGSNLVKSADLVIEVMGAIEPAKTLILEAIEHGASVVTANKALLAKHGAELYAAADSKGVDLFYEAAVAGAVPLIRPLKDSLTGDQIIKVLGIVNGTTNYILDAMTQSGQDFLSALKSAQELGFAEADPSADIEGYDAGAKASILASLAFHSRVGIEDVDIIGITQISSRDIRAAKRLNRVIKLLAVVEKVQQNSVAKISARVHPVMLKAEHPLAGVQKAYNAIFVSAQSAGELMFYGQGAGGTPTASAILGDLVVAARNKVLKAKGPNESSYANLQIMDLSELENSFYLSLKVQDKPGVLAQIASVLAAEKISIASIHQEPFDEECEDEVEVAIVTHSSSELAMQRALKRFMQEPSILNVESLIRVEG